MPKIVASRVIACSPERLWDLMSTVRLRSHWDLSVKSFCRHGAEGDIANTRLHYQVPLLGSISWRWEGIYVTYDRPARSVVKMIRGSWCRPFKRLAGSWVMRQAANGAQLELIVQFESRIPLSTRFMARRIDRVLNQSLDRLDRLVLDVEGSDGQ